MEAADRIEPQGWMTTPGARAVMAALAADGAVSRFVGGCVRDAILDRPVKDVDIATEAPPERVIALLEKAGIRAIPTGIDHGTITAVSSSEHFEITTLRHDVRTFGRHAEVAFTEDWQADATRRDFTINALYCDGDGTLYDPVGGLNDLRAGRVRFVGDAKARITEDVLRLMRFFRFHAWYGQGEPDPAALAACREMAPHLPTLSGERVAGELLRLMGAPDPASVLHLIVENRIFDALIPALNDVATLAALATLEDGERRRPDPVLRLAAALDTDRDGALAIADRLRLSNAERDRIVALHDPVDAAALAALDSDTRARKLYRIGAERAADALLLGWARARASGASAPNDTAWRAALAEAEAWQQPSLPVAGADALALGLPQGPAVGTLLTAVEERWIRSGFRAGREQCLDWLRAAARDAGQLDP